MDSLGAFNLIGLTLLGASLLVSTSLVYGPRRRASTDPLRRVLLCASWFLIVSGLMGGLVGMSSYAAFPLLIIAAIVAVLAFRLFYRQEHAARMWQIAIASERGIPLVDTLEALGREPGTMTAWRCRLQAQLLASGRPLVDVLRETFDLPSRGQALAVGAAADWGNFAPALREALRADEEFDFNIRDDLGRLLYLYVVSLQVLAAQLFILVKIVPVLHKMLDEFDQPVGTILQILSDAGIWVAEYWFVGLPLAPLLLLVSGAALIYFVDFWPSRFPGLSFFTAPLDRAWVMRALAWGLEAGKPIPEILATAARHYRIFRVRQKLDTALELVQCGVPWIDALARVRLLRASDASVLRAAQRVGNLEWALRERAASNSRGWGSALKRLLVILFPVLLSTLGLCALLVGLAMFEALAGLINALS